MPRYRKRVESDEPNLILRYEVKTRTDYDSMSRVLNPSDSDAGIPAYSASWVARLEP